MPYLKCENLKETLEALAKFYLSTHYKMKAFAGISRLSPEMVSFIPFCHSILENGTQKFLRT